MRRVNEPIETRMSSNFPEEVIIEILSWLPVKSLMRFKSVSKAWFQLLSADPRTAKLHLDRSIQIANNSNPDIILSRSKNGLEHTQFYYAGDFTPGDEVIRLEIPFSNPHYVPNAICGDFRVVDVRNGLLCLADFDPEDDSNCYVWNPLTGDYITIQCSPIPSHFRDFREESEYSAGEFYFESDYGAVSRDTDTMFGFGYNEASDEYKVIRFVSTSAFVMKDECHSLVTVYTLGTDSSWRTLEFVPYTLSLANQLTAHVNGAIHWFGSKLRREPFEFFAHETLISFHMQSEVFQEIPQPEGLTYNDPYFVTVGEMGGLLCIFSRLEHGCVEIWVMKEYGVTDSWTRQFKIEQPEYDHLVPLGVANNGDVILNANFCDLIFYDPKTNSVRDLHKFEFEVFSIDTFKGSLLSPRVINGTSNARQPHN